MKRKSLLTAIFAAALSFAPAAHAQEPAVFNSVTEYFDSLSLTLPADSICTKVDSLIVQGWRSTISVAHP